MSLVVLKVGGAVAHEAATALARLDGHEVVVVHGAGPQITDELERRGLAVSFAGGRRVTDLPTLRVVREVLLDVNAKLCAAIGARAAGMSGDEIGLRAARIARLGLVGDPLPSRPRAVLDALAAGLVPVVTPLAEGPLNVNADDAAAALAAGLGAERILFATDVPGVLRDGAVVSRIAAVDAESLIADGELAGGIVPKLEAAIRAARNGVQAEIGVTAVVA
jgi:acetylglutamate kinase